MDVTSIAWRTDLALLTASGSKVQDLGTHLLVTTPDNPEYHWGNFLLLRRPPLPGGAREAMGVFDSWFRDARYRAIAIDNQTIDGGVETAEFEQAGMDRDVSEVLAAERLLPPARPNVEAGFRPLTSDEWAKWVDLDFSTYAGQDRRYTRSFVEGRARQEKRLVDAGLGRRWGAFVDGRLAASAAAYDTGRGIFRFQSVLTHPRRRRRGLSSTLLHLMTERALTEGASTFVTVADPAGPAIGVYRALGLRTVETVTELNQNLPGEIA